MNYQLHTFGCKVNTYDSGLIQKNLAQSKYLENSDKPRVHVLNTCAVTGEATKQAMKLIRKLKIQDPFCTVIVTGCGAQVDTPLFEAIKGADLIVANSHKGLLPELIDQYFKGNLKEKVFKSNIFRKDDLEAGGGVENSHTRSFLKIQDGCNSFCSYCIIPYARGKSRSIPVLELVKRIHELEKQGFQEIVLTGVHIGDYEGNSKQENLEYLVQTILEKTSIPRIRLTSLEPVEVTKELMALFKNERLCPHFHMSIQSANSDVLKMMKRNYSQAEVISALNFIKENLPQAFVGMDVIVGFPTETEEQFEDTYKALAELPWTRLHVFPYSERNGTKAAVLFKDLVPGSVKADRAKKLRELSWHRLTTEALKQKQTIKKVLPLKNTKSEAFWGLSRDYWNTTILNEKKSANDECDIIISDLKLDSQRQEIYLVGSYISNMSGVVN